MNNQEDKVGISKSRGDDTVVKFIPLINFPTDFIKSYNEGNVWGVFYLDDILYWQDNSGNVKKIEECINFF